MSLPSKFRVYAVCFGYAFLAFIFLVDFSPVAFASSLSPGQLIKGSSSAVYYYAQNGKRLVFPNEKIFKTWYVDFSGVTQISDAALAAIPLGVNVTYHPGVRLVKITSDPKVYAVGQNGTLRWVQTEALARTLYGQNWNRQVDDISDAFFVNYLVGAPIAQSSDFSPAAEIAAAKIDPTVTTSAPPPSSSSSALPAMPVISRNVPVYASASSYPPASANDADYGTEWRSSGAMPVWLAYDLSKVAAAHRAKVDVAWYENATYNYDIAIRGDEAYNQPRDYKLQGNAAAGGGAAPTGGWVTLANVNGNTLHSRQQVVDMTGYNWIRMEVTAINGSTQNMDVALNLDVHDASLGALDSWMFYGDSITAGGMQNDTANGETVAAMINASLPQFWPAQEDGGIGGYRTIDGVNQIPHWLPLFPGHYVGISLGTNDVNGLPCADPTVVANNLKTIAQAVIAAGKVPLIPHIPWARTTAVQQCAPAVNAAIDQLIAVDSRILHGPDLYTLFSQHQNYISSDDLHPTTAGYTALRQAWVSTMLAEVYHGTTAVSVPVPVPAPAPVPTVADVTFTVNAAGPRTPISPYIYGSNEDTKTAAGQDRVPGLKLYRLGGNRLTAYNWENNASNAGIDYGPNSSDGYLNDSAVPGLAASQEVDRSRSHGAATLLTIPIVDYVAADKNGVVADVASDASLRWLNNFPSGPSALLLAPNTQDHAVYQDEFVHFIEQKYAFGKDIFFSLDNEPGLWSSTHPLVHPAATTFAEMATRTTQFATMIKQQAPNATVFGAVAYGYNEYTTLQGAPDGNGRDYLNFFLDTAKSAAAAAGHRVVDVLDLHWYPEAQGGGLRITDGNSANPAQAEIDARVQAPRSLWDPTYTEKSWITDVLGGPIALIPGLTQKIAAHYPGTKLSFSEYYYGGAKHISGGIAQADVLGIFGREGIFAATFWPMGNDATSFIYGGFDMFLNYDGAGHSVGDLSLTAQTSDVARTSIYAMARSSNPTELTLVAINKTNQPLSIATDIAHAGSYTFASAYQLTAASATPVVAAAPTLQGNRLTTTLPPLSVTTVVLK